MKDKNCSGKDLILVIHFLADFNFGLRFLVYLGGCRCLAFSKICDRSHSCRYQDAVEPVVERRKPHEGEITTYAEVCY